MPSICPCDREENEGEAHGCAAPGGDSGMRQNGDLTMRFDRTFRWWMLGWILLLLPSCKGEAPPSPGGEGTGKGEAVGEVLVRVGDEVITVEDFSKELASLPAYTRRRMTTKEEKKKALEKMIDRMLLLREATERGLDRDEEIQRKVERYRRRLITEALYREVARERADIGEEEIAKYYEDHKDRFRRKERIRVRQILVLLPPKAGPERKAEAEKKVKEILRRAKAGENFADLAKEFSEGPTASRGGDLGFFSRGRMVPEFEKAAFSLKKIGDIAGPIRTRFGYHIIQLTGREPAKELSLEESRERIVRQLEAAKRREVRQGLASELRGKVEVEIHEDLLDEVSVPEG